MNRLYAAIVFLFLGFCIYANTFQHEFMMDDDAFFSDAQMSNPKYLWYQFLPDRQKILHPGEQMQSSYYRPIAQVVPMICHLIFKENPTGYHVVNLLLFVLAAWCVFIFIADVFKNSWLGFLTGALFLVHPINGVLVNYKTANAFAFLVIFTILSLMMIQRRGFFANVSALIFFCLAIFCHESAMAIPFYAFVLLWVINDFKFKPAVLKSLPLWIMLVAYFIFRLKFASLSVSILEKFWLFNMNVLEYAATLTKLMVWYLSKLFYPSGIVLIWASKVLRGWDVVLWLGVLAFLIGMVILIVRFYRAQKIIVLGLGILIVGFLPFMCASLFQPKYGLMVEPHWFVFSSIGFFLMVAGLLCRLVRVKKVIGLIAIGLIIILWSITSHRYNPLWHDDKRYAGYWLSQAPDFTPAMFYLARAHEKLKETGPARQYYKEILRRGAQQEFIIYTNLGVLDLYDNNNDSAGQYFLKALKRNPNSANLYNCLGIVALRKNDLASAEKYFLRSTQLSSTSILSRTNLAMIYVGQGRLAEAKSIYEQTIDMDQYNENVMARLMMVDIQLKDKQGILNVARHIFMHSRIPKTLTMAASAFVYYGEYDLAKRAFTKIKTIDPNFKDAQIEEQKMLNKFNNNSISL